MFNILDYPICDADWYLEKGIICRKYGVAFNEKGEFVKEDGSLASGKEIMDAFSDYPFLVEERIWHAYSHGICFKDGEEYSIIEDGEPVKESEEDRFLDSGYETQALLERGFKFRA